MLIGSFSVQYRRVWDPSQPTSLYGISRQKSVILELYCSELYFSEMYFLNCNFLNCTFLNCIFLNCIFLHCFCLNCILQNCIFQNSFLFFHTVFFQVYPAYVHLLLTLWVCEFIPLLWCPKYISVYKVVPPALCKCRPLQPCQFKEMFYYQFHNTKISQLKSIRCH